MYFLDHIEHRYEILCVDESLRLLLLPILLRVEESCQFCEIFLDIYLWFCFRILVSFEVALSAYELHVTIPTFLVDANSIGSLLWTFFTVRRLELSHLFFDKSLNILILDLLHDLFLYLFEAFFFACSFCCHCDTLVGLCWGGYLQFLYEIRLYDIDFSSDGSLLLLLTRRWSG